jgi:hypothetical protein
VVKNNGKRNRGNVPDSLKQLGSALETSSKHFCFQEMTGGMSQTFLGHFQNRSISEALSRQKGPGEIFQST